MTVTENISKETILNIANEYDSYSNEVIIEIDKKDLEIFFENNMLVHYNSLEEVKSCKEILKKKNDSKIVFISAKDLSLSEVSEIVKIYPTENTVLALRETNHVSIDFLFHSAPKVNLGVGND